MPGSGSQMDTRICFRVHERKDVNLVLGQGMLAAGWHAHTLSPATEPLATTACPKATGSRSGLPRKPGQSPA